MERFISAQQVSQFVETQRNNGKSIGFVPTMGALHEGHLSLIKRAAKENDIVIASVFVNPTQFNDPNDFNKYPRNVEKDSELLASVGCAAVFTPTADTFYTKEELEKPFEFDFNGLDEVMEGKCRPNHFNGVVQVVSKLFSIVKPNRAYFGQKDFQQVAIIKHMVKVFGFDIEIVVCDIVREPSGLARSSRNELLSAHEREVAAKIYAVLKESTTFYDMTTPAELIDCATRVLNNNEELKVEYFDIVDGNTLRSINKWSDSDYVVGCITVWCGSVRLIDNIRYI